jgi:hypothetical protein
MMLTPLLDEVTPFFGGAPDVERDVNSHGLKIRFEREGFRAAPGVPARVVSLVWLRRSARV